MRAMAAEADGKQEVAKRNSAALNVHRPESMTAASDDEANVERMFLNAGEKTNERATSRQRNGSGPAVSGKGSNNRALNSRSECPERQPLQAGNDVAVVDTNGRLCIGELTNV